jgi:hypothetical protein
LGKTQISIFRILSLEGKELRFLRKSDFALTLTVCLVGVFILAQNMQSAQSSSFLFSDDFSDGVADGWSEFTEENGFWSVINGEYFVTVGTFENGISTVNGFNLADCVIEANLRFLDTAVGYRAGIVFRYIDDKHYYSFEIGDEYDEIDIIKYSSVNPEYGESRTFIQPSFGNSSIGIVANQAYMLKIVIHGENFTAYLDELKVLSWVEETYTKGKVGLRARAADVFFDDFKVYSDDSIKNGTILEEYVDFHISSEDAFPGNKDLNVTVLSNFELLVAISNGGILPNETKQYTLNLVPQYANITTSFDIDLGWMTMTGATNTISITPSDLLGNPPPIEVSYGSIIITVWIHGNFSTETTVQNCLVIPSILSWPSWGEKTMNITADNLGFQNLSMDTHLKYTIRFDVRVEGTGTFDGQTSPNTETRHVYHSLDVIPELPSIIFLHFLLLVTSLATMIKLKRNKT